MDERVILQVLAEQKEELEHIEINKLVNRTEEQLFEFDSSLAQVVIGLRRAGKSTLCHKVLRQNKVKYAYFSSGRNFLPGRNYPHLIAVMRYLSLPPKFHTSLPEAVVRSISPIIPQPD